MLRQPGGNIKHRVNFGTALSLIKMILLCENGEVSHQPCDRRQLLTRVVNNPFTLRMKGNNFWRNSQTLFSAEVRNFCLNPLVQIT